MKKIEFILALNEKLRDLPKGDANEHLNFYSEMIEDRIEEGLSEEEAVEAVGSIDEIARQILANFPTSETQPKKRRQLKGWEIALLAVTSPIWFSLLIAAISIIFSLYAVLWSAVAAIWATFVACSGGVIIGAASGVAYILSGSYITGLVLISCAFACAGIAIFAVYGSIAVTKGAVKITKFSINWIRNLFSKKEEV